MFCGSLFELFLLAIALSVHLRYADSDCPFGIFKLFDNRRHNGLFHKVFRCDSYCDMCFVVTFLVTCVAFGTIIVACVSIVTSVAFGTIIVACVSIVKSAGFWTVVVAYISIVASVVLGTIVVKSLLFQQLLV